MIIILGLIILVAALIAGVAAIAGAAVLLLAYHLVTGRASGRMAPR